MAAAMRPRARAITLVLCSVLVVLALGSTSTAAFRGGNGPLVSQAGELVWLYDTDGRVIRSLRIKGAVTPELSPDSRWIVFAKGGDIAKVRVDGSDLKWLTNDDDVQTEPTWAPDGHRILYVDQGSLFVMRADGSNVRPLNADGAAPAWSPDGSHIAFVNGDVHVMNSDGTEREVVEMTADRSEVSVDWSPDSTRLVAQCGPREFNMGLGQVTPHHICVFDLAGAASNVIYDDELHAYSPAWAPNGRKIAFAAKPPGEEDQEIFTIRPDGTGLTRLTYNHHHDRNPDWGPR